MVLHFGNKVSFWMNLYIHVINQTFLTKLKQIINLYSFQVDSSFLFLYPDH